MLRLNDDRQDLTMCENNKKFLKNIATDVRLSALSRLIPINLHFIYWLPNEIA